MSFCVMSFPYYVDEMLKKRNCGLYQLAYGKTAFMSHSA